VTSFRGQKITHMPGRENFGAAQLMCPTGPVVVVVVVVVYLHDNSNIQMPIQKKKIMQTRSSKKLEIYKQRTLITV